MMKASFRLVLIAVALALVLVSCAKATPTPPPATPAPATPAPATPAPAVTATPKPVATPTPTAAPIKAMTLRVHNWGPERSFTAGSVWWAEQVTERTGGAIEFEFFYMASLGGSADQPDNIKAGLFDIGTIGPQYAPGKTPLYNITSLPGISADHVAMSQALAEISALPAMEAEFKQWNAKYLFGANISGYEYMGAQPVYTVDDFQGLTLRMSGLFARLGENLGITPVGIPPAEIYEAMERGTVDGGVLPIYAFGSYGLYEAADYLTYIGAGASVYPVAIGLDTWNKLDPRVQKIMLEVAALVPAKYGEIYAEADAKWLPKFKEKGIEVYDFPASERAILKERGGKPIWDGWAQDMDEKGLEGKMILDAFLAALVKYEK